MSYKLLQAAARVSGLNPYERCVLISLADRANHATNKCFPAVRRIASDMGVSEREVHRSLKKLRTLGLITVSGHTAHGTNIYSLHLIDAGLNSACNVPDERSHTADMAQVDCQLVSSTLTTRHTNKGIESGIEQGKAKKHTSTINPVLAHAPGHETNSRECGNEGPHKHGIAFPAISENTGDSKLVAAWRKAHAEAGLKCYVTPIDGKKLSLLVRGESAIAYREALEILIPGAVANWEVMCVCLAQKYGISLGGKKPLPKWPHTGFLLRHRMRALEFLSQSPVAREADIYVYVKPLLKEPSSAGPRFDSPEDDWAPPEFGDWQ